MHFASITGAGWPSRGLDNSAPSSSLTTCALAGMSAPAGSTRNGVPTAFRLCQPVGIAAAARFSYDLN
jgi:hypothetical protein